MKKQFLTLFFVLAIVSNGFAGGVTDNNNGNKGDILIHAGKNNGSNSIGTWVNSDHFKGEKGDKGNDGQNGVNGLNGIDGLAGTNGVDGDKGDKGDKGDIGKDGQNGIKGDTGKGLNDRYEIIGEVRLLDTKKTTWSVYGGRDINNDANIIGAKVVVKVGTSYEERRLNELEKKINFLVEEKEFNSIEVVPDGTGFRVNTTF